MIQESFVMTRDLLTKEGLYSGISSGSAVVGAMKWVKRQGDQLKGKNVLVILPDSGNRYLSKAFNDDWMREAGFLDQPSLGTVSDLLHVTRAPQAPVIMAKQTDKVSAVIERMREKSISQLPVADDAGWIKGVTTEGAILTALYEGRVRPNDAIEQLVDSSVEFVTPQDPIEKVSRLVTSGKTPLVHDPNKKGDILSIITKIDLLSYLGNRQ
jgi:cystathionine beta-synthase